MNWAETLKRLDAKRFKVKDMKYIPDVAYHSRQWRALMLGYDMLGLWETARICEKESIRYHGYRPGAYTRTICGSYVNLEAA